jgi:hypothetical protein
VAGTGKKRDLVRVLDVTPAGKRQTVDFTVRNTPLDAQRRSLTHSRPQILSGVRQSGAVTSLALRGTQLALASEGRVLIYDCIKGADELKLTHSLAAPKRDDYSGYYRSSSSRPIDTLNALTSLELVAAGEQRVLAVRGPEVRTAAGDHTRLCASLAALY